MMPASAAFTGFDSAWTATGVGSMATIRRDEDGSLCLIQPEPCAFDAASMVFSRHAQDAALQMIGIDQPLIVPNAAGQRPVERAVSHVIGRLGGGVQPANRSRARMFDDGAPIWPFLRGLQADIDPRRAVRAVEGRYVVEVFPALGNAGLFVEVYRRRRLPKYNPARKKTFRVDDWRELCHWVAALGQKENIRDLTSWAARAGSLPQPRKSQQDDLDAILSALITFRWWSFGSAASVVVGDLATGYMVLQAGPELRLEIESAAAGEKVSCLS